MKLNGYHRIYRLGSWLLILFLTNACVVPKAEGQLQTRQGVDTPSAPITTTLPVSRPLTTTAVITQVDTAQATPATPDMDWQTFTSKQGVSFRYPGDWQGALSSEDDQGFEFSLRRALEVAPYPYTAQIVVGARPLPKEQEASLYFRTGYEYNAEGGVWKIVWDKVITLHGIEWHLQMLGTPGHTGTWDGLDYIADKDGITGGGIAAIHYEESKNLAITFSQELGPDLLIFIDQKGADALFPEQVSVFAQMLESVVIQQ